MIKTTPHLPTLARVIHTIVRSAGNGSRQMIWACTESARSAPLERLLGTAPKPLPAYLHARRAHGQATRGHRIG